MRVAKDGILLMNAGVAINAIFFVVHIVLGRFMGKVEYATVVSLMSLMTILGVPASAIQVVMARYVAEFSGANQAAIWVSIIRRALKKITLVGVIATAGWCLATPLLKTGLNAPSVASLIVVGFIAFISLYSPIVMGTLQGAAWFGWLAISRIATAIMRLVFAAAVVMLGFGVTPVLGAIGLSMLLGLIIGTWPFRKIVATTPVYPDLDTEPIYRYLWPVLFGQAITFVMMGADVILMLRFLPETELAAYGKAATLSRSVLFLIHPMSQALFPRAVRSARMPILIGTLLSTLGLGLVAASGLTWWGGLGLQAMYGMTDPLHESLVCLYAWGTLPLALTRILAEYLWARHRTGPVLCLLPVMLAYLVALFMFHETARDMMVAFSACSWVSLAVLSVLTFRKSNTPAGSVS